MNRQEILDKIATAPDGQVEQSEFFVGKRSQIMQVRVINLLADLRRKGEVSVTVQDGKTYYRLPSHPT